MEDFSSNVASCGGASFSGCIWEVPLDTMDLNEDFNSSHENKKALSPFYHKKYFWQNMNVRHPIFVLHSFSIKNIFYYKIDLRLFYFHVTN